MQGVEVFESVGLAAEEVTGSDEKIEEVPIAVAAQKHPLPLVEGQKPSRFQRINVAKQSGISNIHWNILCAWEVSFPKIDSKGKGLAGQIESFQ